MDISSVSALPVTLSSRASAGTSGAVQAASTVSGSVASQPPVSSTTDSSNPVLSQAATSGMANRESPSTDTLTKAVKQVNEAFDQKGQNLYASFEKDKMTGINVVKIIDKKTKETISQMPPKEMVALAQFLEHPQGMRGQLLHATA